MDFKSLYYLTKLDRLGSVRISRLLNKFGSSDNVLKATIDELISIEGIDKSTARKLLNPKLDFEDFEKKYNVLLTELSKKKIGIITIEDNDYPEMLKNIYDPPIILYYKGDYKRIYADGKFDNMIGIVGTRRPSEYGKSAARKLSIELAESGISVVSGFARGIDTCAHSAILNSEGHNSITAGVLGCGVNVIYPSENFRLYEKICEQGLLLSEYELNAKPDAVNFPKRNRIISGLSLGVIIVESGKDGGALITARYALDQSREVFAVPGSVFSSLSDGTNDLIKNGQAKLVRNIEDVIIELEPKLKKIKNKTNIKKEPEIMNLQEKDMKIYKYLSEFTEPVDIDSISVNTELSISDSLVTLLNLEFKGIVKQLPGKRFILN